MVDLRENDPWQKTKTPREGQTRKRGCMEPSRDRKELEDIPYPYALTQGKMYVINPHRKGSYTQRGESIQDSTTIHLQGNGTFRGP